MKKAKNIKKMFSINNAEPLPIEEAAQKLKDDHPGLLLEDERVDIAFKAIRDEYYFTSHRILVVDKQGVTGKKVEYKSCPYHSIKAFSCQTAGSFDADTELKIYGASMDVNIDFNKKKFDILEIQKYLGGHVFVDSFQDLLAYNEPTAYPTDIKKEEGKVNKLIDNLAGDSVRLQEEVVQGEMQSIGALVPNEMVKLAYKCGRDMVICTSKRMLYVDTKGLSGKRVEYLSMRWSCIKAYEVETAGRYLDRDATFKIFTNISQELRCISTDLRKGQSDIREVLWFFNNMILGMDDMTKEAFVPMASSCGDNVSSMMSWFGDDMSQIDAGEANQHFHSSVPVLQSNEVCEIAFKGRRDLVLFTTKRILFIDKQGWSGNKMAFTTVPYSSVKIFNVRTAGSMDKDCEFGFFTEIWYDPPKCSGCENGCGDEQPTPGMAYIEFDINKHTTDLLGLYRYVAQKVYALNVCTSENPQFSANEANYTSPPGSVENFLNYFGQNFTHMDTKQVESSLGPGGQSPVLVCDEKVLMAFKCGRDSTVFTSKAILDIDVQGFTGKRVEFRCIPYEVIRHFSAESSGSFDRDSELKLAFSTPWLPFVARDFRSGKVDIVAIQNLIASKILGAPGKPSDFVDADNVVASDPGSMSQILAFIKDKHLKMDPKPIEQQFKTGMPILQVDEEVEMAFKNGRDMFLITNKRILSIDVQGLTGKKVEFSSLPYKHIAGFSVQSAGTLSFTVKATLFISKLEGGLSIDLGKKYTDIFQINNSLGNKILKHTAHQK